MPEVFCTTELLESPPHSPDKDLMNWLGRVEAQGGQCGRLVLGAKADWTLGLVLETPCKPKAQRDVKDGMLWV